MLYVIWPVSPTLGGPSEALKQIAEEMSENGLKLVKERFCLDKVAEQMVRAYESVVIV